MNYIPFTNPSRYVERNQPFHTAQIRYEFPNHSNLFRISPVSKFSSIIFFASSSNESGNVINGLFGTFSVPYWCITAYSGIVLKTNSYTPFPFSTNSARNVPNNLPVSISVLPRCSIARLLGFHFLVPPPNFPSPHLPPTSKFFTSSLLAASSIAIFTRSF
ncbi:MAG: hypothetical protein ACPLX7_10490, partial [Candidatus Kapaibacteriota bacterium]